MCPRFADSDSDCRLLFWNWRKTLFNASEPRGSGDAVDDVNFDQESSSSHSMVSGSSFGESHSNMDLERRLGLSLWKKVNEIKIVSTILPTAQCNLLLIFHPNQFNYFHFTEIGIK